MVCTDFRGGYAHDLQTTGLHADKVLRRKEMEKSLLGLAARKEGRNAAALSLPPLVTCREDKAFLFHFHGVPEMPKQGKHGFQRPSRLIFVTFPGAYMVKACGVPHTLPHLTVEKGKLKSQELSGGYKYHRSHAESRLVGQNKS